MTRDDVKNLRIGDRLRDRDGNAWIVTDFTHAGENTMPTVVRTMVITFPDPWEVLAK